MYQKKSLLRVSTTKTNFCIFSVELLHKSTNFGINTGGKIINTKITPNLQDYDMLMFSQLQTYQ